MKRILNNRITITIAQAFIQQSAKYPVSRNLLNWLYLKLTYSQKRSVHGLFAKLFRNKNTSIIPGSWKVVFLGKEIFLPLKTEEMWLDWDTALSIIGHDIELKETYEFLLAQNNKPDLFVDIGANYGTHSLLFLCHGIETITFEPNSSCHSYFQEVCILNNLEGHLEKVALGEAEGVVKIKYPEKDTWLGSTNEIIQEKMGVNQKLIEEEVIQKKLDNYLDKLEGKQILIKIDTEGNEYSVFQGAENVLKICKPLVIFECCQNQLKQNLYNYFSEHGYGIHNLPWKQLKHDQSLTYDEFLATALINFIAVPKN